MILVVTQRIDVYSQESPVFLEVIDSWLSLDPHGSSRIELVVELLSRKAQRAAVEMKQKKTLHAKYMESERKFRGDFVVEFLKRCYCIA